MFITYWDTCLEISPFTQFWDPNFFPSSTCREVAFEARFLHGRSFGRNRGYRDWSGGLELDLLGKCFECCIGCRKVSFIKLVVLGALLGLGFASLSCFGILWVLALLIGPLVDLIRFLRVSFVGTIARYLIVIVIIIVVIVIIIVIAIVIIINIAISFGSIILEAVLIINLRKII